MLELLPDLGDEIVVVGGVTGEQIRQVLATSVQTIDATRNLTLGTTRELNPKDVYAGGEFLQISSSLKFSWYFQQDVAMVGDSVYLNGVEIDDERHYTVAVSNRLLSGAAYGSHVGERTHASSLYGSLLISDERTLDADPSISVRKTGVSHIYAVSAYLNEFHPTLETALDPETEYVEPRIVQSSDIAVVHIAVLCGQTAARREQCDHALHAIDLINTRMNGFHDDLVPEARLVAHERTVGCSRRRAFEGVVDIARAIQPDQLTAVVLTCSEDVASVSSVEARAAFDDELSGQGGTYVVVSPSSTAPSLSDDNDYPFLARLATPESEISDGLVAIFHEYHWDRVAVLHDDSLFAASSAQTFVDQAEASTRRHLTDRTTDDHAHDDDRRRSNQDGPDDFKFLGGGQCLAGCEEQVYAGSDAAVGVSFSLDAFDAGELSASAILDSLTGLEARIIYVSTYPRVQRSIFAESMNSNRFHGTGYAWVTNLPSVDSLYFDDGTVDVDAAYGAEGSLGFIEHRPEYDDYETTSRYLDLWAPYASTDACVNRSSFVPASTDPRDTYCDIDNDPKSMTGYSAFWVDSIVVLAQALTGYDEIKSSQVTEQMASDIYSRIVNLEPQLGVSRDHFV